MPRPASPALESGSSRRLPSRERCPASAGFAWLTLGLLLIARVARAGGPEIAELEYDRPPELARCPDEAAFRLAVSARLRRDPFQPGAARKIRVLLTKNGATLTALVRVEEAGRAPAERRIDTRSGCDELASGAALAVSIAIDPLSALGLPTGPDEAAPEPATKSAAPPANPAPREAPPRSPAKRPAPPKAAPRRRPEVARTRWFVRAGEHAWVGLVPKVSDGPSLGFGYQRGLWSLGLDALFVLPRTETVPGTRRAASVTLLGAQLSPCLALPELRGCALISAGALRARGEGVDDQRSAASFDAAAGIGIGYSFFFGRFFLTPSVQASARFTTTALALDGSPVWTTPRVLGSLGLEIGYDVSR